MKKLTFLLLFSFLGLSQMLLAQTKQQNVSLQFESNEAKLDHNAMVALNQLVKFTRNYPAYQVELFLPNTEGQTELSKQREKVLVQYLLTSGLKEQQVVVSAKLAGGNSKKTSTDQVELLATVYEFTNASELLQSFNPSPIIKRQIDNRKEQEISTPSGLKLKIPANAFVSESGKAIDASKIEISLQEYNSFGSAMINKVSTMSDGQILESGGMFYIEAKANNENLALADGKEIDVNMPSKNLQPGMSLFTGQKDSSGVVQWQQTDRSFALSKPEVKVTKLPLTNTAKKLKTLKKENSYSQLSKYKSLPKIPIAKAPAPPSYPKTPAKPYLEDKHEHSFFLLRWLGLYRPSKASASRMAQYKKQQEQYAQKVLRYHQNYKKYQQDSLDYLKQALYTQYLIDSLLLVTQERHLLLYQYYSTAAWNEVLAQTARKMEDSLFYNHNLKQYLVSQSDATMNRLAQQNEIRFNNNDLVFLKTLCEASNETLSKYCSQEGYVSTYKTKKYFNLKDNYSLAELNPWGKQNASYKWRRGDTPPADHKLCLNERFKLSNDDLNLLEALEAEILEQKQANGVVDRSTITQVYTTSIPSLGYINCDRFLNTPKPMMVRIEIPLPIEANTTLFIPRLNSILVPYYDSKKSCYYVTIPKGEAFTLMSVRTTKEEIPDIYVAKMATQKIYNPTQLKIEEKKVSVLELKELLTSLN